MSVLLSFGIALHRHRRDCGLSWQHGLPIPPSTNIYRMKWVAPPQNVDKTESLHMFPSPLLVWLTHLLRQHPAFNELAVYICKYVQTCTHMHTYVQTSLGKMYPCTYMYPVDNWIMLHHVCISVLLRTCLVLNRSWLDCLLSWQSYLLGKYM